MRKYKDIGLVVLCTIMVLALTVGAFAASVTINKSGKLDRERYRDISISVNNAYPSGGYTWVTSGGMNLIGINHVSCVPTAGYVWEYDTDNKLLKAYRPAMDWNLPMQQPSWATFEGTWRTITATVRCRAYGY